MNKDETTKPKEEKKEEELKQKEKERLDMVAKEKAKKEEEEKPKEETLPVNLANMKLALVKTLLDKLVRMERMLEWLIVQRVTDDQKLIKQPNIADIFKEIASKMDDKKTEGGG